MKFCFGRIWIFIIIKFINENEVVNGRVIIIFFFVCVFKRSNLFLCFEVLKKRCGNR